MVSLEHLRQTLYRHSLGPLYDYLEQMEAVAKLEFNLFSSLDDYAGSSATAVNAAVGSSGKFSLLVTFELVSDDGQRMTWYSGSIPVSVSATTAGTGTAAIKDSATEVAIVDGIGSVTVEYIGTWAAEDEMKMTIGEDSEWFIGSKNVAGIATDTLVA